MESGKLKSNQSSVVIPTDELIKNKKVDLRVLACISAISNVDDCTRAGENNRYCSIKKLNNNLDNIAEILGMKRRKVVALIRNIIDMDSNELRNNIREYNNVRVSCLVINYSSGGFVAIDFEILEELISKLSNNAFKLYVNLLWICRDNLNERYIERAISQEYLCELIGLSKSSTKTIRKLEHELIDNNLLSTRVVWESMITDSLSLNKPRMKKYYKLLKA